MRKGSIKADVSVLDQHFTQFQYRQQMALKQTNIFLVSVIMLSKTLMPFMTEIEKQHIKTNIANCFSMTMDF